MATPKRRQGPSRQGKRRAHVKLRRTQTVPCEVCGAAKLRHRVCFSCGTYKRKSVLEER